MVSYQSQSPVLRSSVHIMYQGCERMHCSTAVAGDQEERAIAKWRLVLHPGSVPADRLSFFRQVTNQGSHHGHIE